MRITAILTTLIALGVAAYLFLKERPQSAPPSVAPPAVVVPKPAAPEPQVLPDVVKTAPPKEAVVPEPAFAPAPAPVVETKPEAEPPALEVYKGRKIAQTMHWTGAPWLQRKTREEEENGGLMQQQLEIKPGQTVCDLGSGDGYHTLWMASVVGETGKVYAVDIQQEMLDLLQKRAVGRGIKNITSVVGAAWDPKLPPNSQDLILLVDVYHEFSHPEHMLIAMRKALKPDGRLALVEFRSEDPRVPIKEEHKMSKEQILKEIPPMGFKLVREFDELPWQHLMFFTKDGE